MAYNCKFCALPNIAEIFAELKAGIPRTAVCSKYKIDDYQGLGKCFYDHRAHDHSFEVAESIKQTKKMRDKELRKPAPDRLAVKDLETRLASLRKEEREINALQKAEHFETPEGETPITVEAIDRILQEGMAYCSEGHTKAERIQYIIDFQLSGDIKRIICSEIEDLLAARGFSVGRDGRMKSATYIPAPAREMLPVRRIN